MSNLQFDDEGGVAATQSKKRFIAPAVALLMVSRAADDGEHEHYSHGRFDPAEYRNNYGGRVVAGGIGFGLVGSALGRISRPFGVALGFYGAGRSIYLNVVARGPEVKFSVDTPIEIRFGSR